MQATLSRLFLIFLLLTCQTSLAQVNPETKDSLRFYKNLETHAQKSKFTKFMYSLVFKSVTAPIAPPSTIKKKIVPAKLLSSYEGKIIRKIEIHTIDPLGYSLKDTLVKPKLFMEEAGNALHIKTLRFTIKNLLLFKKNQLFDSLKVQESERLIRSQRYVRDVSIYAVPVSPGSDSVDIHIRVLDEWSIIAAIDISDIRLKFNLNENNFLGTGHQFKNDFREKISDGSRSYSTEYYIPNIRNTYINSDFHYFIDFDKNQTASFAINRPFYSPLTKYAGGFLFSHNLQRDSLIADTLRILQTFKYNTQDYWVGRTFKIFSGHNMDARSSKLVLSARFLRVRYVEDPTFTFDTLNIYSDQTFYFTGIGISTRKYVQDKFLFKYGVTEDIPVGKAYSLVSGFQIKNNIKRIYAGLSFSLGNFYPSGYYSANFEYGTFINSNKYEQGTLRFNFNYFSNLILIRKWKLRQFVRQSITYGIRRTPGEKININGENGLKGFNSDEVTGTKKLLLTLQTQTYAPFYFLGFRFGPYLICSLGMLGDDINGFSKSKLYSQFGIGLLVKNELLVLSSFQVSLAFYPTIPGTGYNILKYNSFSSTDFKLRDYDVGKPSVISFQ